MTSKIRLAVCAAAALALITWVVMADRGDIGSRAQSNNTETVSKPRSGLSSEVDKFKSILSSAKSQADSAEINRNAPEPEYASQAEIEAMSIDEYLDYMNGLIETLPSEIQAEIQTRKAIADKYWESLGFFSEEQKQGYASYDKETLEAMGNQGDLLAWDVLSHKNLTEDRSHAKFVETSFKSVLFGSAKGARSMANASLSKQDRNPSNDTEDRSHIYNAMAWLEIAIMMGDRSAPSARNAKLGAKEITLSEQEWALVRRRAEAINGRLNEKRREMGLPEFNK
ncbi:MAG: hypothetical protein NVV73_02440 [Cellvibrionaceae bacterium]|nr:hypothetical protein [Cellvibrionaceae bacterium]